MKWHEFRDILPRHIEDILVLFKDGTMDICFFYKEGGQKMLSDHRGKYFEGCDLEALGATHWMYLPELPEGMRDGLD